MASATGDFELTIAELRIVARFAAQSAQDVLHHFEDSHPHDPRARAAVDAAWSFAKGASRTRLQRVTALDAHRAAKAADTEEAKHAAHAAGDAAAAAYLHPLAQATQVGHILRAAAHAARSAELTTDGGPLVGEQYIEQAMSRATPELVAVLTRYPPAPSGKNRVAQLMTSLDTALRATG